MIQKRWRLWRIVADESSLLVWTPWFCLSLYDHSYHWVTRSFVSGYELWWNFDRTATAGMICFKEHREHFWLHITMEQFRDFGGWPCSR